MLEDNSKDASTIKGVLILFWDDLVLVAGFYWWIVEGQSVFQYLIWKILSRLIKPTSIYICLLEIPHNNIEADNLIPFTHICWHKVVGQNGYDIL